MRKIERKFWKVPVSPFLHSEVDTFVHEHGYVTRAAFIRTAVREKMLRAKKEKENEK